MKIYFTFHIDVKFLETKASSKFKNEKSQNENFEDI